MDERHSRFMFTDASCHHAALGALVVEAFPEADPALLLGSQTLTRAVVRDEHMLFGPALPGLIATLRSRGYKVDHTTARAGGGASALVGLLEQGATAVAEVDTFYLDHFWMSRGQTHALHSVILREFEAHDRTVRMVDPGDVVFFDGRLPISLLDSALDREDLGQNWLVLTAPDAWHPPGAAALLREWAAHREALAGRGNRWLSGVELAGTLGEQLDDLFAPARDGGSRARYLARLQHGIWAYHHTLRWFARYLTAIGTTADRAAPSKRSVETLVDRAAQDWLVVRSLLRHAGLDESDRALRSRSEVSRRLERIASGLARAAEQLPSMEEEHA